jgi:hypothetical protein
MNSSEISPKDVDGLAPGALIEYLVSHEWILLNSAKAVDILRFPKKIYSLLLLDITTF